MKVKYLRYLFLIAVCCLVLLMAACSGIETGRNLVPSQLKTAYTLLLPFQVDKCVLDQVTGTYYLTELNRPNLYFYRNGTQINVLGGLGNDKTNFQKLGDIALDTDGNVVALDTFARKARKYSPDGKWLADTSLSSLGQPAKLASTAEGDLIVFDSATRQLSKISALDGKTIFTFGRFQVEDVFCISCSKDYIAVVNGSQSKTVLFSSLGMYMNDVSAPMVLDMYQNQYIYLDGAVRYIKENVMLPLGWQKQDIRFYSSLQTLMVVHGDTVLTIQPVF